MRQHQDSLIETLLDSVHQEGLEGTPGMTVAGEPSPLIRTRAQDVAWVLTAPVTRWIVGILVVLSMLAIGGLRYLDAVETRQQEQAEQEASRQAAETALTEVRGELAADVANAQTVLSVSENQVADNTVRQDLLSAIGKAETILEIEPWPSDLITYSTTSTELDEAVAVVAAARDGWVFDNLTSAIMNARDVVLAGSAGKVADDAVRTELQTAITSSEQVWALGVGGAAPQDYLEAATSVQDAAAKVTAAQGEWQTAEDARLAAEAEAARVAAEQAAAEQARIDAERAAQNSPPPSSTGGSTPTPSRTQSPSTPAPTQAPTQAPPRAASRYSATASTSCSGSVTVTFTGSGGGNTTLSGSVSGSGGGSVSHSVTLGNGGSVSATATSDSYVNIGYSFSGSGNCG